MDKLRKLRNDLDKGTIPKTGYASYTVRQAAGDWLARTYFGAHTLDQDEPGSIDQPDQPC